jgi:hypothetical protein
MVELDAVSVGLVGRRQRQTHRRVFFITEVEEHHIVADLASTKGQQVLRGELSDERVGLQAVSRAMGRVSHASAGPQAEMAVTPTAAQQTYQFIWEII